MADAPSSQLWPVLIGALSLGATLATALHVVFHKRDVRAAVGWLGLIWFVPLLGLVLYWIFGINRIRRRARLLFSGAEPVAFPRTRASLQPEEITGRLDQGREHLITLARLTERVTSLPLVGGNELRPLVCGDQAYPAMLQAIEASEASISLTTYIFGNDVWGRAFKESLTRAVRRGVEVRVLIDDVGSRYSFPPIVAGLKRAGLPTARFMRSMKPWRFRYYNLRSHRKIMVVDGKIGFTGGMNIRAGNVLKDDPAHPVQDVHFQVRGPVVAELQKVFADDWKFTTDEELSGRSWFPRLEAAGGAVARAIPDGPDEDYDKLRLVILGALTCARDSVRIVTPYFLPDEELTTALKVAAYRGVEVQIFLPAKNNLRLVEWASQANLEELLLAGCRILLSPPPFDHSKILLVDGEWVLLGSANLDPRSLKLNFELNVEVYDRELAGRMAEILAEKATRGRRLTTRDMQARTRAVRLRDNVCRLMSPYL